MHGTTVKIYVGCYKVSPYVTQNTPRRHYTEQPGNFVNCEAGYRNSMWIKRRAFKC